MPQSIRTKRIAVIDYGLGNLHSVHKALLFVADGWRVDVTHNPDDIVTADKVVFPGVGAIGACIAGLRSRHLSEPLIEAAKTKPMLAICVGFQALFYDNEEDTSIQGLGILEGRVRQFPKTDNELRPLKVPHMGWNKVYKNNASPIWKSIDDASYMYFVHSYFVEPEQQDIVAGTCYYNRKFAAMCVKDQLIGCQFHPEKSHKIGLQLLTNFVREM